ncbi:hypothetical protein CMU84_16390 [Elizabethkingia anophelis]|uniref:hypothetical protein n=1 Tax=Elizabethkingia miricola TaxID=172045 RepID=UPI000B34D615|nr:hypothetical protein [Elizabethkingia miricola]MDV3636730.1 hypothetical protein [Elizabethkingia anophelis]MDV3734249.1 hypothetical protein [Elizabethkingia anophelis]
MEERKVFGFSELKYETELDSKEFEMSHSMAFQSELIPYPDNSYLLRIFGGIPTKKESFLSKYKKGKRPQGKHRSKLKAYKVTSNNGVLESLMAYRERLDNIEHLVLPKPPRMAFIPPKIN